jgi:hypothetical protein
MGKTTHARQASEERNKIEKVTDKSATIELELGAWGAWSRSGLQAKKGNQKRKICEIRRERQFCGGEDGRRLM